MIQYGQWYPDFPGQQPYQDPAYMRMVNQQHQQQQQPQQATRTVEVVPADTEKEAQEFPVAAGATKIILARNDSFVAVKSVSVTGEVNFDLYDKRPPAPPAPTLNPSEYVRKDELSSLISEAIKAEIGARKTVKKEEA